MITVTFHQLLLLGVFLYVLIGAVHAIAVISISMGFTGRPEFGAAAAFLFFWLPIKIARVPMLAVALLSAGIASGATYLLALALS